MLRRRLPSNPIFSASHVYRLKISEEVAATVGSIYLAFVVRGVLDAGGLNLVPVEIKLTAQRFIYFRDQPDPFLRGALQSIGSAHTAKWLVMTVQLHHGARTAPFYRKIAGAIALLEQQFSWLYLLTVKPRRLYRDLLAKLLPPPLY